MLRCSDREKSGVIKVSEINEILKLYNTDKKKS